MTWIMTFYMLKEKSLFHITTGAIMAYSQLGKVLALKEPGIFTTDFPMVYTRTFIGKRSWISKYQRWLQHLIDLILIEFVQFESSKFETVVFKSFDDVSAIKLNSTNLNFTDWNSMFLETVEKKSKTVLSKSDMQEKEFSVSESFAMIHGLTEKMEKMEKNDLKDKQKVAKNDNHLVMAGKCSETLDEERGKDKLRERKNVADCQRTVENLLEEILSKVITVTTTLSKTTNNYVSKHDIEGGPTNQEVRINYISYLMINSLTVLDQDWD